MTDPEISARIALLTQVVRMMMRERAFEAGKTPADVLAYAETVRRFFEAQNQDPEAEMYVNAQVSAFFDVLAQDLKKMRETR